MERDKQKSPRDQSMSGDFWGSFLRGRAATVRTSPCLVDGIIVIWRAHIKKGQIFNNSVQDRSKYDDRLISPPTSRLYTSFETLIPFVLLGPAGCFQGLLVTLNHGVNMGNIFPFRWRHCVRVSEVRDEADWHIGDMWWQKKSSSHLPGRGNSIT